MGDDEGMRMCGDAKRATCDWRTVRIKWSDKSLERIASDFKSLSLMMGDTGGVVSEA